MPLWQFHTVRTAAWWTLVAGAGVFAAIFLLGGAAFLTSRAPALSFLLGWRLLILASTLEVIVQGVFAVWLSYWVSSYFFKVYVPKLIFIVGAMAPALAAIYAVIWMFKKVRPNNEIEGELLTEQQEPRLWARVKALAQKVGTVPPDHIVGGIDTNFFVTQVPMTLNGQELRGRILFVSLPLLRIFDEAQADAVLAHELAHFRGGDTKWTSLLGPKLQQFDLYCYGHAASRASYVAAYILRFYRLIFEFALKRGSRQREFIADSVAAKIASGQALVQCAGKVPGLCRLSQRGGKRALRAGAAARRCAEHRGAGRGGARSLRGIVAIRREHAAREHSSPLRLPSEHQGSNGECRLCR